MSRNNTETHVYHTFTWPQGPSEVSLAGHFDLDGIPNWSKMHLEQQGASGCFKKTLRLPIHRDYAFKFVVDGNWVCHPDIESRTDSYGYVNNHLHLMPPVRVPEIK